MPSIDVAHYQRKLEYLLEEKASFDRTLNLKVEQWNTLSHQWCDRAAQHVKSSYANPLLDAMGSQSEQYTRLLNHKKQLGEQLVAISQLWKAASTSLEEHLTLNDEIDKQAIEAEKLLRKSAEIVNNFSEQKSTAEQFLEKAESNRAFV